MQNLAQSEHKVKAAAEAIIRCIAEGGQKLFTDMQRPESTKFALDITAKVMVKAIAEELALTESCASKSKEIAVLQDEINRLRSQLAADARSVGEKECTINRMVNQISRLNPEVVYQGYPDHYAASVVDSVLPKIGQRG